MEYEILNEDQQELIREGDISKIDLLMYEIIKASQERECGGEDVIELMFENGLNPIMENNVYQICKKKRPSDIPN